MADIQGINVAAPVVPYTTDDTYATHFAAFGKGGFRSVTSLTQRNNIPKDRLEVGMVVNIPDYPTVGKSTWYTLLSIPVGAIADVNWKEVVLGSGAATSPYVVTKVSATGYISKTAYPTFQAAIDASASGDVIDVYGNTGVSIDGVFNVKPVVSNLADLPPVYVILNGNCNGNIDVKSGNSVLFSGNGTLFGMLAINGGIVVLRKATISKMTGQPNGPGIMFNSGSLAIENAIIKTAQNQLSIDTISSTVMQVSLYGILNANPIGANVRVNVLGNNFGTLDNVISIPYADALAIQTNKSIEKFNAGVFYRITNRVLQGTGTTGDVVVAAIGDYELSTAGQLYAGVPDYVNVVVWQEITNDASLVIYLGKTYTATSTAGQAGLHDYPNAGTGSWAIPPLPNADINGNTTFEWDEVDYSLSNDFISSRKDKRGNIVSISFLQATPTSSTIDQFLWGHDLCRGNHIKNSNLSDTFLKAAVGPFIFNNVINATEFIGMLGTVGIDAPSKILGLTMTGCSMTNSNLINVTGHLDALIMQKAIVQTSDFYNFSSSVLTDCIIIGLGLVNYGCDFTGNQITKATIVSTTGPTLPTNFSNVIVTGTLYMGLNENHSKEIIGYNDPKLELPIEVIREDGTTSYINYWPGPDIAPNGSMIRIRGDFGNPYELFVTPSFVSIYVEANALFTFDRLCPQTLDTFNRGRMVFSGPGTMRGKIIVYNDNPVKLLIQGLRHEGTFSNDANSINALNADVKWNNVICVPPPGYPYLNTRSRNGAYGGSMWFKYQFYQCRFQISGVSDSPSHYVNFAPNTIATAFQLGAFNYSPGPNDAIDKANCLLEATGCSFYGDGVSGNAVLATYGGFATYRFANNTFYGITPALDASDPNFGVFGVINTPPIVGRLLSGVSTTYTTAQLAADAMSAAGGGTVVSTVDIKGPLVLTGNVSLLAPGRRIYLDSTAINTDTLTLNGCIGTIECAEISRDTAGSGYALVNNGGYITLRANKVINTQGFNAIFCNGGSLVYRGNVDFTYNSTSGTGERIAVLAFNYSNVQMRGNINVYSNDTVGITEGITCFGQSTVDYEGIITIVNKGRIARNQGGTMTLRGVGRSADKGILLFNSKTDLFFSIDTRSTVFNVNNAPIVAGINAAGAGSYTLLHSGTELLGSIGVASINNANPAAGNYVVQVVNSLIQNNLPGPAITIQYLTPGSGKGTIPWTSTATFAYPDTATYDTPSGYTGGNRLFRWDVITDTTQVARIAPLSATNTIQASWVEVSPSGTSSSLYTSTGFAQDGAMTQLATTTSLGYKADILSPTLTGVPKSPTASLNDNTIQISTTEFATRLHGTAAYLVARKDSGAIDTTQTSLQFALVFASNGYGGTGGIVWANRPLFGGGLVGRSSILDLQNYPLDLQGGRLDLYAGAIVKNNKLIHNGTIKLRTGTTAGTVIRGGSVSAQITFDTDYQGTPLTLDNVIVSNFSTTAQATSTAGAFPIILKNGSRFYNWAPDPATTITTVVDSSSVIGYNAENIANKGIASGYAGLDSASKVPAIQLPTATTTTAGITLLYPTTGTAIDGAMTQQATTNTTGLLVNLVTSDKTNLVNAINENKLLNNSLNLNIGVLVNLQTVDKSNIVNALNEVKNSNQIFANGGYGSASILRLGWSNTASAYQSAVLGGESSQALGQYSTVFSGYINQTLGHWSSIIGGDHNTIGPLSVQAVGAIIGSTSCTINSRLCLITNSSSCTIAQGCDNTTLIGCSGLNITTGTNQTYINNVLYVPAQSVATTIMLVGAQGNPIVTTQVDTSTTASVVIGSDFVWDSSYAIGKTVSMEFCSSATVGKTLAASLYTLAGANVGNSGTSGFTSTPGLARTGTFTLVNGTTYQIRIAVGSGTGYLHSARLIIK